MAKLAISCLGFAIPHWGLRVRLSEAVMVTLSWGDDGVVIEHNSGQTQTLLSLCRSTADFSHNGFDVDEVEPAG